MLAILKTTPAGLKRLEEFEPGCWIDLVNPTEEELERVSQELVIPLDLLKAPLDEEEKSRIEFEDGLTHVIVDIPVLVREEDQQGYETIPLGMLVHPDYFITTCLRTNPILGEFEQRRASATSRPSSRPASFFRSCSGSPPSTCATSGASTARPTRWRKSCARR